MTDMTAEQALEHLAGIAVSLKDCKAVATLHRTLTAPRVPEGWGVSELKPCPFCGGDASADGQVKYSRNHQAFWSDGKRITKAYFVNCIKCGISNRGMLGHRAQAAAIAAWNRRAEKEEG